MKNCAAPISKGQKLLLKVLTCLWNQFLKCNTHATTAYLRNPNDVSGNPKEDAMKKELNAYSDIINNHEALLRLSTPTFKAYAYIVAANAQGDFAYNTAPTPYVGDQHIAHRKQFIKLNVDECLEEAYQVSPVLYVGDDQTNGPQNDKTYVTEAMIVTRAGCQGVSNIGFVAFAIQVDIDAFPFKTCPCGTKCGKEDSTSSH